MQGLKGFWQRTSGRCANENTDSNHGFVPYQDKRQLAGRDDRCQSRQRETAGTKHTVGDYRDTAGTNITACILSSKQLE